MKGACTDVRSKPSSPADQSALLCSAEAARELGGAAVAAKHAQEGPGMKTFGAFVAIATIAGSLTATPVSAQRGGAAPGRYYPPDPYGSGPGPYDYFGSCEWIQ